MLHDLHPVRTLLFATALLGLSACRGGGEAPVEEPPVETPPAPAITSIVPAPVPATTAAQTLTIRGANFVNGAIVHTAAPGGSLKLAPANTVEFVSATELRHEFRSEALAGTWQLRVTNPDSQSSAVQAFAVEAPAGLPSITSVSPNPMPGLVGLQELTISGSNFDEGASLEIRDPTGATQAFEASQFTRVSNSELTYQINNLNLGGTWQVRVINGDDKSTGFSNLVVETTRRTTIIQPGANATQEMLDATANAQPGDTIEFDCGFFELSSAIQLSFTEDILVKGCGVDETVLSFRTAESTQEGILADNVRGLVVEDLTIADSAGNGIELRSVDHATLRRVRTYWSSGGGKNSPDPLTTDNWNDGRLHVACTEPPRLNPNAPENEGMMQEYPDYEPSVAAGRYGVYPVKSRNILVTEVESIGASDAGIYVGQSSNSIIEKSRAAYNVFGFEIENVQGGEYRDNLAECNTGGFLVYDLDGLTQYGSRTRMYNNISRNNNTYNFAKTGSIVSQIPNGSGMITLAYDQIDVFDNTFEDNEFAGIIHISYELLPDGAGRPSHDRKIDYYTEGMHIFGNTFRNSGGNVPEPTSSDIANEEIARLLPALVASKIQAACGSSPIDCPADEKGGYRGAHIIFDGLEDSYNETCAYPTVDGTPGGEPVPADENGKPLYTEAHANPDCYYNAYKFDTETAGNPRKKPEWFFSCIDADNDFSDDSVVYANFRGTKGANAAIALATNQTPTPEQLAELEEFPADLDMTPHDCVGQYGSNLDLLPPVVIPPFVPSGDFDPQPTPEEIAALCDVELTAGEVNFPAFAVDCPTLDSYNLFSDADDPTSTPNSSGVPFVLNSKLFSDYSLKYRVLYLPPGTQAVYRDGNGVDGNTAIAFPVGTIIAKTFSFNNGGTEDAVETRLLIKRTTRNGSVRWGGVAYRWEDDGAGGKIARLASTGATESVSWNYTDPDTGALHTGSTASYSIPTRAQCLSCHANLDGDPGAAPIGPKVRNLNRPFQSESPAETDQANHPVAGLNQIQYWCENGIMNSCPEDLGVNASTQVAENVEHVARFTVAGSSGHAADSDADIEARARAWLEVNCQHCHNPKGFAANTGFYLDVFRPVDSTYGICKGPTATGSEGSGGRKVDIFPTDASRSILEYRIGHQATTAAARMPPIARSVVDEEALALIQNWIDNVLVQDNSRYPNSEGCPTN